MPAQAPGHSPHSGAQTMPASEQSCGWAVTMARDPAGRQSPLTVQGSARPATLVSALSLALELVPGSQALNVWLLGRARNGGSRWREGWGGGEVRELFSGPETTARSMAWALRLLSLPSLRGHRAPLCLPHPHPLSCAPTMRHRAWHFRKKLPLLQVPRCPRHLARVHGVPSRCPRTPSQPGCSTTTGSAHAHPLPVPRPLSHCQGLGMGVTRMTNPSPAVGVTVPPKLFTKLLFAKSRPHLFLKRARRKATTVALSVCVLPAAATHTSGRLALGRPGLSPPCRGHAV